MLEVTWGGLKQSLKRSQKLTLRMDELSDMVQSSGDVMEDSEMRKHPMQEEAERLNTCSDGF